MIELISVQFRNAGSAAFLPLRRLAESGDLGSDTSLIPVPEWQPSKGSASGVAICAQLARNSPPKIAIALSRGEADAKDIWIRAVDASGANLLGTVEPVALLFGDAMQITVPIELCTPPAEVASHKDAWSWEFAESNEGPWQPIATTEHPVYVTLAPPNTPWDADDESRAPWIDVLDVACRWAAGADAPYRAADCITTAIFALGARFAYQGRDHFVSNDTYDVAFFLASLNGAADTPRLLNCCDCAAAVSTFANILGCTLLQGQIMPDAGNMCTNPVRLIGIAAFAATSFGVHEIAWGGPPAFSEPVWDACLMVDGDDDPMNAPHVGVNALGMKFGMRADLGYLWRLLNRDSADLVKPRGTVVERGNRAIGMIERKHAVSLDDSIKPGRWFYWNVRDLPRYFSDWSFRRSLNSDPGPLPFYDSMWRIGPESWLVRIRIQAAASLGEALALLQKARAEYTSPVVQLGIGDASIGLEDRSSITFVRGNLLISVESAAPPVQPVADIASQIDESFTKVPPAPGMSPGQDVTLDLPLKDSNEDPLWYRIFSPTGEVRAENGEPHYLRAGNGPQTVTVFRHDVNGIVTPQTIPIL